VYSEVSSEQNSVCNTPIGYQHVFDMSNDDKTSVYSDETGDQINVCNVVDGGQKRVCRMKNGDQNVCSESISGRVGRTYAGKRGGDDALNLPKCVRILNWNVEGLMSKICEADFMQYIYQFDILCFTETFLEKSKSLDCFPDYLQFISPATKLTQQGRSSGGVVILVKRKMEKYITVMNVNEDNMVWLKLDKRAIHSNKDVILGAVYVCPMESPYYKQNHITVNSSIFSIEQCLLNFTQQCNGECDFLVCGDFNARVGENNVGLYREEDDAHDCIQSDLYEKRVSEDKVVNTFGKLLLDMCSTCDLTILNGACQGDLEGKLTYICSTGCSTVDYYMCSPGVKTLDMEVRVAERFETKHMPVELTMHVTSTNAKEETVTTDKLIWDESKIQLFKDNIYSDNFKQALLQAQNLLLSSIDDAVFCLNEALTSASECMRKKIYKGSRYSKWFDAECKASKRETRKWWRKFRRTKCEETGRASRLYYVECRKSYRALLREKRAKYKTLKLNNLIEKMNDSKGFWSELRSIRGTSFSQPNISEAEWFQHFKGVFTSGTSVEQGNQTIHEEPASVEYLDKTITEDEIRHAINHLKLNKSPGPDCILGEMLKNSTDIIVPFLLRLFNVIFHAGKYPKVWSESVVIPIFKSGNKDNPDHYRGVSLMSILGKVFARILNTRLTEWAEANKKFAEEQSGFRKNHSTIDNIFVLFSIIQKYLLKKSGKVYVCFIDFKKAFDTVNRSILWNVLRKAGVGGKMLKILQSMYSNVRSCVRCTDGLTDYFECPIGVRQGCVLSPTLFSFLINELADEILHKGTHGIQLTPDIIQILILLFADDVILASHCIKGLQKQIDIVRSYADNFSLRVNLEKTKIIVFRKGGFLGTNEKWMYGIDNIQVVNSYKYLGLYFSTKLSLIQSVSELASKAKARTAQLLRGLWRLGFIQRNVFFKIFDCQVLPILLYGAELWGYQRFQILEKAHLFACKRFLNVAPQTPNSMVYGDLGRYPVYITSAVRCVKYWLRIANMTNERLPKKAYNMMCHFANLGKKTWAYNVKKLLFQHGFSAVWEQQNVGDMTSFINLLRQRLFDAYHQEWHDSITRSERFEFYTSFKHTIVAEKYLDYQIQRCFKDSYTRFRLGISPILVHKLRYKDNVRPRDLLCPLCKHEIESEDHVLFACTGYTSLRSDVLILQSEDSSGSVMSSQEEETITQLSRYLYKVFQVRESIARAVLPP
jgi:hypothetical protein